MQFGFFEHEEKVALANGGAVETISAVEANVELLQVALKFVAGEPVDEQTMRMIEPFLGGNNYEPMIAFKARRLAFPNFPLAELHRSGCWGTVDIAASSSTRSESAP